MASGGQALGRGRGQRRQQGDSSSHPYEDFERSGMLHRQAAGDGLFQSSRSKPGGRGRAKKAEKPVYIPKPKRQQMEMEAQREAGIQDQHHPPSSPTQHNGPSQHTGVSPHNGMPADSLLSNEAGCLPDEHAGMQAGQHQRLDCGHKAADHGSSSPRVREKKPSAGKGRREIEIYVPRARRSVDSVSQACDESSVSKHSSGGVMSTFHAMSRCEGEAGLPQEESGPSCSMNSTSPSPESSSSSGKKSSKACTKSMSSKDTPEARRKSKTNRPESAGEAAPGNRQRQKRKPEQNSHSLSAAHPGEVVSSAFSDSAPVPVGHSQGRISQSLEVASKNNSLQACGESTGLDKDILTSSVLAGSESVSIEMAAEVDSSIGAKSSVPAEPSLMLGAALHFEEVDDYFVDNDNDQDSVGVSGSMVASQEDQVSPMSQDKGSQFGGVFVNSQDNINTCPVDLSDQLHALSVETTDFSSSQENDLNKPTELEVLMQVNTPSLQEDSTCSCSVQAKVDDSTVPHQLQEQQISTHQPDGTAVAQEVSSISSDSVVKQASPSEAARAEESTDVLENAAHQQSGTVAAEGSSHASDSTAKDPVASGSLPSKVEDSVEPPEQRSTPQHSETAPSEEVSSESSDSTGKGWAQGFGAEEDSWEAMFNDSGEFIEDSVKQEISNQVGKVKVKKAQKTIDYLSYKPRPRSPDGNYDNCDHLIEIYDFPERFKDADLINIFRDYKDRGFDLKWVDDTHAIGVFASAVVAVDALSQPYPCLKVRPISDASQQTKHKVKRRQEFLQPYKERPETTSMVAKNLITNHLGLRSAGQNKEKRDQQRKQLKEARERKRQKAQAQDDAWEGTLKNLVSDDKP